MFTSLFYLVLLSISHLSTTLAGAPTIAKGYIPGWGIDEFPLSTVSWSKYTEVTWAFGETAPGLGNITLPDPGLDEFVKVAHENNVKACLSLGGWTGSVFFSTAVGSAENRTAYVKTVLDLVHKHKIDCLDLDWEYPNRQGLGCNTINANDTLNYILFMEELRAHPSCNNITLSAAVSLQPFNDASGNPSTNLTRLGNALDHVVIMNYDVWGPWSDFVGPNSPLEESCAPKQYQQGSAQSALENWTKAGVPLNKIVLGVPNYGHSFVVAQTDAFVNGSKTELAPYPPYNKTDRRMGDKWDDPAQNDTCGNFNPPGGLYTFMGMVLEGLLSEDGSPKVPYRFDNCSKTAYVYDCKKGVEISYDDAKSSELKGQYISQMGLAGFSVWHVQGDYKDILLDAVRKGAGFKSK
ncbi:glycoside hydrolase family 18 protein [Moniliophthora roreri MCA 2997]|uniref:Glycoside hydrolase family 18 protein n=1 Tax=Moniliophthora roreri (strain MCA 2997) TaxID=1381753 RepID=V2WS44_MONRO|nr:glycoside hydrolase family 18 protein [Moniliophthora roreri MCA 2997]